MKTRVLIFGFFALCVAPFALAQDYGPLKREVKMNEAAGEGDIYAQIETRLEDAARLSKEARRDRFVEEELRREVQGFFAAAGAPAGVGLTRRPRGGIVEEEGVL